MVSRMARGSTISFGVAWFDSISRLDWSIASRRTPGYDAEALIHCRAMETLIERARDVEFLSLSELGARIDGVGVVDETT